MNPDEAPDMKPGYLGSKYDQEGPAPPHERNWHRLQEALAQEPRKRRPLAWAWLPLALLLCSIGGYLGYKQLRGGGLALEKPASDASAPAGNVKISPSLAEKQAPRQGPLKQVQSQNQIEPDKPGELTQRQPEPALTGGEEAQNPKASTAPLEVEHPNTRQQSKPWSGKLANTNWRALNPQRGSNKNNHTFQRMEKGHLMPPTSDMGLNEEPEKHPEMADGPSTHHPEAKGIANQTNTQKEPAAEMSIEPISTAPSSTVTAADTTEHSPLQGASASVAGAFRPGVDAAGQPSASASNVDTTSTNQPVTTALADSSVNPAQRPPRPARFTFGAGASLLQAPRQSYLVAAPDQTRLAWADKGQTRRPGLALSLDGGYRITNALTAGVRLGAGAWQESILLATQRLGSNVQIGADPDGSYQLSLPYRTTQTERSSWVMAHAHSALWLRWLPAGWPVAVQAGPSLDAYQIMRRSGPQYPVLGHRIRPSLEASLRFQPRPTRRGFYAEAGYRRFSNLSAYSPGLYHLRYTEAATLGIGFQW